MKNLNIEYVNINDLCIDKNNARKHGAEDIGAIKSSIAEFGMCDPIGIWGDENVIVEGAGRLQALKELGHDTAPVIRLDHLTDEQRRAYALAHNRIAELSTWDKEIQRLELEKIDAIDMGAFGFDLSFVEKKAEAIEDDFIIKPSKSTVIETGDVFQLGNHRLMCGDSTSIADVEKLMEKATVDLLLTDPPYNVSLGMESIEEAKRRKRRTDGLTIKNDKMKDEEFYDFLLSAFTNAYTVMKAGACFYVWYASREHCSFEKALCEAGLRTRQQLIWKKSSLVMGRQDYQWNHEPCLYGWKEGAGHLWASDRKQTTVFDFDKPNRNTQHPTMKPVALFDYQIKNNTKGGDVVLDLFGGSGTTIIACEQNGRKAYVMELDPRYAQVIINRWEAFTGGKVIKIN